MISKTPTIANDLIEFNYQNNPTLIDKRKLKIWNVIDSNGYIIETIHANWYYMNDEYNNFRVATLI